MNRGGAGNQSGSAGLQGDTEKERSPKWNSTPRGSPGPPQPFARSSRSRPGNQARHLPACLEAPRTQRTPAGTPLPPSLFEAIVFANDCSDGTAEAARAGSPRRSPFAWRWSRVRFPLMPPMRARRGGWRWIPRSRVLRRWRRWASAILTTDADSRTPPNWIERNLAAIDAGADAVLGRLALDEDSRSLPEALHRRGALESEYEALLTEVFAMLDPVRHNPWPHHATISGASVAVTADAYRRIGGLPRVAVEDKALVAELLRRDARLRFDNAIEVVTSARLDGRAAGGVADTLRLRARAPDALCDEALEPYRAAELRARWRRAHENALGRPRRGVGPGCGGTAGDFGVRPPSAWRKRTLSARRGRSRSRRALFFCDGVFARPTCRARSPPPERGCPRLRPRTCSAMMLRPPVANSARWDAEARSARCVTADRDKRAGSPGTPGKNARMGISMRAPRSSVGVRRREGTVCGTPTKRRTPRIVPR